MIQNILLNLAGQPSQTMRQWLQHIEDSSLQAANGVSNGIHRPPLRFPDVPDRRASEDQRSSAGEHTLHVLGLWLLS